jgi:site-specific DNA recombinase
MVKELLSLNMPVNTDMLNTVNKYMAKRKLTKELVDAFVSEIVFYDGNIEVKLLYDDFLKELLKVAEEREVSSNG